MFASLPPSPCWTYAGLFLWLMKTRFSEKRRLKFVLQKCWRYDDIWLWYMCLFVEFFADVLFNVSNSISVTDELWWADVSVLMFFTLWWVGGTTGSASDQQSEGCGFEAPAWPTKVVCITVLTGNRLGWTVRCGRPPLLLPSCRKLEFRLSALIWLG